MIAKIIKKIYHNFFFSSFEKKLFDSFAKKRKTQKSKNIILVQCVEDYYYFGLFGAIISSLQEKEEIQVEQYVIRNLTLGSTTNMRNFLISIFFANRFKDNKWIRLYSSYCDDVAYRHEGSSTLFFDIKALFKAYRIFKGLSTKEKLLSLTIEEIKVGDLIYDTYLRFKPAPTVRLDDFYLCFVLWKTIRNIELTQKYFKKKKPKILLTSYSTYIQHGIAVRVAVKTETKVYAFGNFQEMGKHLTKEDVYHTVGYQKYREEFELFLDKEFRLMYSKEALEYRLDGGKDIATSYMKESAYKVVSQSIPEVENHIVIFLHDFFDSPHVYGEMVFYDFLEWIEFTIETLEKFNIPFYLKPHPNQIGESQKVIERLKVKYPKLKFISPKITNRQLVEGGISAGISVYGTVAHELVYMGVPVVLCGENPHSSYSFCFEAKTKEEYKNFIKDYEKLAIISDYKEEIESFYYMHNLNSSDDMKELMKHYVRFFQYCSNTDSFKVDEYMTLLDNIQVEKVIKEIKLI